MTNFSAAAEAHKIQEIAKDVLREDQGSYAAEKLLLCEIQQLQKNPDNLKAVASQLNWNKWFHGGDYLPEVTLQLDEAGKAESVEIVNSRDFRATYSSETLNLDSGAGNKHIDTFAHIRDRDERFKIK